MKENKYSFEKKICHRIFKNNLIIGETCVESWNCPCTTILHIVKDVGMKDHFIHLSHHPSVSSWSIYSNRVKKIVEYRRGKCLHIINNFYLPHVMVLDMLNCWEDFVLYPRVFFYQRSQGDLTLFSRLKSFSKHLKTPLLMGKFYVHSSYSVIVCLNLNPWASFASEKNHRFKGVWYISGLFMAI